MLVGKQTRNIMSVLVTCRYSKMPGEGKLIWAPGICHDRGLGSRSLGSCPHYIHHQKQSHGVCCFLLHSDWGPAHTEASGVDRGSLTQVWNALPDAPTRWWFWILTDWQYYHHESTLFTIGSWPSILSCKMHLVQLQKSLYLLQSQQCLNSFSNVQKVHTLS